MTREAVAMMYTRYRFAAELSSGRDVLEVACGAGQGLGLLAARARRVVAGDTTARLARAAKSRYGERLPLLRLDAHALPFRDAIFDVVVLCEAIYYLTRPGRFAEEARRVLRRGGALLICSANRLWGEFNPSPHSVRYFSADELAGLLGSAGFRAERYGAYPAGGKSLPGRFVGAVRKMAVALRLVPKTMTGKEKLKRLFYGKLVPAPAELDDPSAPAEPVVPLSDGDASEYKVIYAIGRRI